MNDSAQSTQAESRCDYCSRPWFGRVAYCPYCGHKAGVTTINQDSADRASRDDGVESEPETAWIAAAMLQGQQEEARSRQPLPFDTPRHGLPPAGNNKATASRAKATASTLLLSSAVTGIGALLLYWLATALHTYSANEGASAPPVMAGSSIGAPTTKASSETTQMGAPPPTDAGSSPNSARSLCSARDEAAGLCKPQQ